MHKHHILTFAKNDLVYKKQKGKQNVLHQQKNNIFGYIFNCHDVDIFVFCDKF